MEHIMRTWFQRTALRFLSQRWKLSASALLLGAAALLSLKGNGSAVALGEADRTVEGQEIFRFDTFGDEQLWTDQLKMHQVIEESLDPLTALQLGLKVDVNALPDDVLLAIANGEADLTDPATTVGLIKL